MAANKKFDVFLSHNSKDEQWVIRLKDALEAREIDVWLDSDDIRPGDIFAKALEQGIHESKAVALIISPESMGSGWVEAEYYRALSLATNKELQLIPVLYKKAQIPGFLKDRSWVDFSDPAKYEEKVSDLIWGITGKKPASSTQKKAVTVKQEKAPVPPSTRDTPKDLNTPKAPPKDAAPNPGPINEPVDTPLERFVRFVLSAAVLVGLIVAIRYGISLNLLVPGGVIDWIGDSTNPRITIWVVSSLIGSVVITLPQIGIKAAWANNLSQINHLLFTYLIGLSPWITMPIIAAAIVSLVVLQPVCQSPTASIRVRLQNNETFEYQGKPIEAKAGETISLSATSNDSAVIFCSWSSTGSAISSLSAKSVCNTQVHLAKGHGKGIVTLSLSKSSCSVVSTTPLQIITVP